tara:strand:- start:353 stop:544 length:192 start_codon:yes stop_codon:yes gene_type:complete
MWYCEKNSWGIYLWDKNMRFGNRYSYVAIIRVALPSPSKNLIQVGVLGEVSYIDLGSFIYPVI